MSLDVGEERIIAALRPHGRALIIPTLATWLLAFGAFFLLDRVPWDGWNTVVLCTALVLFALLAVVPYFAWLARRFVFTDRKIIVRAGLGGFRREVPYSRIHDLTLRRRGLQRLFGCGDILVSTGGERLIVLGDVPRATLVQRVLIEQLETTRFSFEEDA